MEKEDIKEEATKEMSYEVAVEIVGEYDKANQIVEDHKYALEVIEKYEEAKKIVDKYDEASEVVERYEEEMKRCKWEEENKAEEERLRERREESENAREHQKGLMLSAEDTFLALEELSISDEDKWQIMRYLSNSFGGGSSPAEFYNYVVDAFDSIGCEEEAVNFLEGLQFINSSLDSVHKLMDLSRK